MFTASEHASPISCAPAVLPGLECVSPDCLQVHRRPGGGGLCTAPALRSSLCAVRCRRAVRVAPRSCSWLLQPPRRPPSPLQQPQQPEQRTPAGPTLGGAARGSGGHEQPGQRWREGLGCTHCLGGTPRGRARQLGGRQAPWGRLRVCCCCGRTAAGRRCWTWRPLRPTGASRWACLQGGGLACKEVERIWLVRVP